jgi:hypothetical protein
LFQQRFSLKKAANARKPSATGKMNRRRTLLVVIVGLALVGGMVLLSGSRKPLAKLKIVRLAVEQGKPVVVFQVEGAEGRRLAIFNVLRIEGDETENAFVQGPNGVFTRRADFWAPNEGSPAGLPEEGRKEFGIVAPSAAVWKLRLTLDVEDPKSLRRFTRIFSLWEDVGKAPLRNLRDLAAGIWDTKYTHPEFIESQLITNAIAFGGEFTK